jgi:hypothetical protein
VEARVQKRVMEQRQGVRGNSVTVSMAMVKATAWRRCCCMFFCAKSAAVGL